MSPKELERHMRIRKALAFDVTVETDETMLECYEYSRQMWLNVICDAKDTWKYWPVDHITKCQLMWQERMEIAEAELIRRGLKQ